MNPKRWKIEDLAIGMKVRRADSRGWKAVPVGTEGKIVGFEEQRPRLFVIVQWENYPHLENYEECGVQDQQLIEIIEEVDEWADDLVIGADKDTEAK